ncbi:DNA-binding protein (plasmid) [Haloarcula hispanica N601]|uniref:DNA-binding protein n=2 Tax=Haloarcula hispanica TaxID=51589 RepID=V5TUH5_HALHI|nr:MULTISPECIES: metal-dependent transcriptional regulator [Haloarcula]AEM59375.1 iron dependent repressor [Haloarcula hispanica ATCC 33960]AHB68224.1 DNA-binding protein [Haloarcula hispanica N601]AJF27766.1 DNA-binding protein [Haloarcula sp. CBA1115]KZX46432.1 DNA-binding protein [Haloarcula sp. K1]MUV49452.1 MarR family transcriptional regulator [Haloarcula sp. CBA1122]
MSSESQTGSASSLTPSVSDIERSAGRYLFAVSVLSESPTERVSTGELQEFLNVTPASVTEMVSKLDERGLVDYEKYQGVTLTDRGDALVTEVGWRFCVVSTFFESVLDTTLDEQTAFDIGFLLPKNGVFRLRSHVGGACLGHCPEAGGDGEQCVP